MRNRVLGILRCFGVLGVLMLTSCDQMELCYNHDEHAPGYGINVKAEWQLDWQYTYEGGIDWEKEWASYDFGCTYNDLCPSRPEGIRVVVYPEQGGYERFNIEPEGGHVSLSPGNSSILIYNNGTEYIVFNNIGTIANATATTRSRSRASYTGSPYTRGGEEQTVNSPDYLFGHYIPSYHAALNEQPPLLPVTMRPLVCTYFIRFRFARGFQHVVLARGALAGMAGSVYLTDGHTDGHIVTILFDIEGNFDNSEDSSKAKNTPDCLTVRVNSFGAPNYPNPYYASRAGDDLYGLNLEVMLRNGKVMKFDFDVSEQVRRQPRGGVIEVDGITITDEDASEGSADGFNVSVNGWGEDKVVPLDFGKD